jgi:hypothetical protein
VSEELSNTIKTGVDEDLIPAVEDAGKAVEGAVKSVGTGTENVAKNFDEVESGNTELVQKTMTGSSGSELSRASAEAEQQGQSQVSRILGGEQGAGPKAIEAGPKLKELDPGKGGKTLQQVRNTKGSDRWKDSETYSRQQYGGGPERAFPVPANSDPDFPVTAATVRKVDCPVDLPNGGTLAVEVKHYGAYRTVTASDGSTSLQKVEVPLSSQIKAQIHKDVALRNADPGYDPRWEFQNAPPSDELRDYLTKAGIIFIEHK